MSRSPEIVLEVPPATAYLAAIRLVARTFARSAGFSERVADEIQLAVDEVCAAAAERAPAPERCLRIELGRDARKLWIEVTDRGNEWPLVFASDVGVESVASESDPMGYVIVSAYMDEVDFQQTDEGSLVRLVRSLPGASGRLRRV